MARELAALGHDVRVVTAAYKGLPRRERVEGFEVVATAHRDPPAGQTNAAPWFSVILKRPGPAPVLRQATRRGPGHR